MFHTNTNVKGRTYTIWFFDADDSLEGIATGSGYTEGAMAMFLNRFRGPRPTNSYMVDFARKIIFVPLAGAISTILEVLALALGEATVYEVDLVTPCTVSDLERTMNAQSAGDEIRRLNKVWFDELGTLFAHVTRATLSANQGYYRMATRRSGPGIVDPRSINVEGVAETQVEKVKINVLPKTQ